MIEYAACDSCHRTHVVDAPCTALPRATLIGARRFDSLMVLAVAVVAIVGVAGANVLLSRIDNATAEAAAARSEIRLVAAQAKLREAARPAQVTADLLCRSRTLALRSAIRAMLLVNHAAFERHPGTAWVEWR